MAPDSADDLELEVEPDRDRRDRARRMAGVAAAPADGAAVAARRSPRRQAPTPAATRRGRAARLAGSSARLAAPARPAPRLRAIRSGSARVPTPRRAATPRAGHRAPLPPPDRRAGAVPAAPRRHCRRHRGRRRRSARPSSAVPATPGTGRARVNRPPPGYRVVDGGRVVRRGRAAERRSCASVRLDAQTLTIRASRIASTFRISFSTSPLSGAGSSTMTTPIARSPLAAEREVGDVDAVAPEDGADVADDAGLVVVADDDHRALERRLDADAVQHAPAAGRCARRPRLRPSARRRLVCSFTEIRLV